jgi:hypothetical protein
VDAVTAAEVQGRNLFNAVRQAAPIGSAAIEDAKKRISNFCDLEYTAVPVEIGGSTSIYFLGRNTKTSGLVIGRHFKVTVDRVEPSSVSCLTIPAPTSGGAGFVVTYLLSQTPSEFHVYLSLTQPRPLFVATNSAIWSVNQGLITYLRPTGTVAQPPAPSTGAPADKVVSISDQTAADFEKAVQPLIAEARSTYPAAKARFEAGLPPGYRFFVVTRLHDSAGRFEQAFIRVDRATGETVLGRLASQLNLVSGYKSGDSVTVAEADIVDWVIVDPKGAEEGNVVGKFIDTYRPGK